MIFGPDLSRDQRPVACTLYPESGEHTVQVVETAETSASLAFKVTTVESPGFTSKSGITETHERRYRSVVAFGRTGSKPGWDFKTTPVCNEIAGDINLLLMISCDANIKANAEISVSAAVQLQSGGLNVPFLTSRSKSDVAKLQFPLA